MDEDKAIIAKCNDCGNIIAAYLDLDIPEVKEDIIQCIRDGYDMEYVDSPVTIIPCKCG